MTAGIWSKHIKRSKECYLLWQTQHAHFWSNPLYQTTNLTTVKGPRKAVFVCNYESLVPLNLTKCQCHESMFTKEEMHADQAEFHLLVFLEIRARSVLNKWVIDCFFSSTTRTDLYVILKWFGAILWPETVFIGPLNGEKWDGELNHLSVLGWAVLFSSMLFCHKNNRAQPKTDKWFSYPSHCFLFLVV